jgi:hypothetical protein
MTTKLSFACVDGEHWACPGHPGVEGFPCDCHCHHLEPIPDATTVHDENESRQGLERKTGRERDDR